LARAVAELPMAERAKVLQGLGLGAADSQAPDRWVRTTFLPQGDTLRYALPPEDREHLVEALRTFWKRERADGPIPGQLKDCPVQVVDSIEKRTRLLPTGKDSVEKVEAYWRVAPPALFLTPEGVEDFELELLKLRDKKRAEDEERKRQAFRQ